MFAACVGLLGCRAAPQEATPQRQAASNHSAVPGQLTFADVRSGHVEEWRSTPGTLGSRFAVPLSPSDIREFRDLVKRATVLAGASQRSFISGRLGVLHTAVGEFGFCVGKEKIGSRTYRASLRPFGPPDGRDEVHLRWSRKDGRELMAALTRMLDANAGQAKPVSYVFFTGHLPWWHSR